MLTTFRRLLFILAATASPAFAQDFTILVTSTSNNGVVRFDQDGNFLNQFVYPGSAGLTVPLELVFGPDGRAYLSDRDGDRIAHFTSEGGYLGTFAAGSGLNNPHGLDFGPDGHLYVAGEITNAVLKFDGATGAFLGTFVSGLDLPVDLEFTPSGDLIVADRSTIRRYDAAGNLTGVIPYTEARGITTGPDGRLYVGGGTTGQVMRYSGFDPATASVFVATASGYGLRFGPDGHLYLPYGNQVHKFDGATGAFLGVAATGAGLSGPTYVTFGPAVGSTIAPQLAALQQQVADLIAENTALRQQADQLGACIADLTALGAQVNTLLAENQMLRDLLAARDLAILSLQAQLTEAQASVTPLQAMIASLARHVVTRIPDANVAEAARAYVRTAIDQFSGSNKRRRMAEQHYQHGIAAIARGQFTTAVHDFRQADRALKS